MLGLSNGTYEENAKKARWWNKIGNEIGSIGPVLGAGLAGAAIQGGIGAATGAAEGSVVPGAGTLTGALVGGGIGALKGFVTGAFADLGVAGTAMSTGAVYNYMNEGKTPGGDAPKQPQQKMDDTVHYNYNPSRNFMPYTAPGPQPYGHPVGPSGNYLPNYGQSAMVMQKYGFNGNI
jgi:hypothetical protein